MEFGDPQYRRRLCRQGDRMRRRDFIGALMLSSLAGRASAQHSTGMKRIAMAEPSLSTSEMKIGGDLSFTALLEELERLGFVEGHNLTFERYSAEGQRERYGEFARGIVTTHPDLIVSTGVPLTKEFKAATSTIPIVALTGDPIRFGLITSLAHPSGNVTGVSVDAGVDLWAKRLELLAEAVPKLRNVLFVSTQATWEDVGAKATREAAQRLGISLKNALVGIPVNEQAYRRTFDTIGRDRTDGLIFSAEVESYTYRLLLVQLVHQIGIPAIYFFREQTEAGGLMSYSADLKSARRIEAGQIAEILHGRNPSEMPYVQATRFELVINLKTAKELGVIIPPTLTARADEVIE
jgi:ABC-type uncharacterized transport system substrate-binding protein